MKLPKNESNADRIIRVIVGIVALVAGLFFLTGTWQVVTYVIGAIAILTGAIGFCAIYAILGISTKPIKK